MDKQNILPGPRLIREIAPRNVLSFGPQTDLLPLESLNVLIGPNGAGKSNLLEAIALLRSSSVGYREVIAKGGGISEWIWKGQPDESASIEAVIAPPDCRLLRHAIVFRREQQFFRLKDEWIAKDQPVRTKAKFYHYRQGRPIVSTEGNGRRKLRASNVDPDTSILAQLRDPERFPEITKLAAVYGRIRLYREWSFGRKTVIREPQRADLRTDRLEEDFSNLGLFLKRVSQQPKSKGRLLEGLKELYEGLTDFDVSIVGGTVQIFFTEGDFTIPAPRLSDGSLRYLCLLAILCDPDPPPLIGIEEPELGLHPDLLPKVADLLLEASTKTQLLVTTHSDILVDALTERPAAVIVCEKHDGQTKMHRLAPEDLTDWLQKYRLGQLWIKGQLGGTRW